MTVDCVTPAHIERTPENEHTRQPKATPTLKPTASQHTAKIYELRTAIVDKRCTAMSKPSRTGVCTEQNLNAQTTIKTKETAPAVNQGGEKTEEQSNKRATLYKVPHARTAITFRANGKYEGLRAYSRIPLHFRKDVLV